MLTVGGIIMDYRGVIFDFNGTLFFDNDKHVRAWGEISKLIRGHGISDEELHQQFNGTPNEQNIQYMKKGTATKEEIIYYSKLKEKYYRDFCKEDSTNFHLVAGVEEYFNYLRQQQIPFTIASASIKENIDFFIESFHLDHWIDPDKIVYDDGSYPNKINMFKDAAKKLNVSLDDILVFEDSLSGIKNAYLAGIHNIIVICPDDEKETFLSLPGVIKTMSDFTDLGIK